MGWLERRRQGVLFRVSLRTVIADGQVRRPPSSAWQLGPSRANSADSSRGRSSILGVSMNCCLNLTAPIRQRLVYLRSAARLLSNRRPERWRVLPLRMTMTGRVAVYLGLLVLVGFALLACSPGRSGTPPGSGQAGALFSDTFDDPNVRNFPETPGSTAYRDGALVFLSIGDPLAARRGSYVTVPGTQRDAGIAVDVRAPQGAGILALNCRQSGDLFYQASVDVQARSFRITKGEPGLLNILVEENSDLIRTGDQVNRIELICAGSQITVEINGRQAGRLSDSSYSEGQMALGVRGQGELRFDNLVVTSR